MKRDKILDQLRGFAIVMMILTHSLIPFWSNNTARAIWNWTHFSVPLFVFCSLIIFFKKPVSQNWKSYWVYVKKRFLRMLIPYYIYIAAYFTLRFFLSGPKIRAAEIIQSLYLGWGDASWLVILFLCLSVLTPIILYIRNINKKLFYLFGSLTAASTIYFTFNGFQNYQIVMWLPWSVFLYYCFYFARLYRKDVNLLFSFIIFISVFALAFITHFFRNNDALLFNNKYPPDLYYLSYGLAMTSMLYYLSKIGLFNGRLIDRGLTFFSLNSYSVFFIQFLLLDILDWTKFREIFSVSKWYSYFIIVIVLTYFVQKFINYLRELKSHVRSN